MWTLCVGVIRSASSTVVVSKERLQPRPTPNSGSGFAATLSTACTTASTERSSKSSSPTMTTSRVTENYLKEGAKILIS